MQNKFTVIASTVIVTVLVICGGLYITNPELFMGRIPYRQITKESSQLKLRVQQLRSDLQKMGQDARIGAEAMNGKTYDDRAKDIATQKGPSVRDEKAPTTVKTPVRDGGKLAPKDPGLVQDAPKGGRDVRFTPQPDGDRPGTPTDCSNIDNILGNIELQELLLAAAQKAIDAAGAALEKALADYGNAQSDYETANNTYNLHQGNLQSYNNTLSDISGVTQGTYDAATGEYSCEGAVQVADEGVFGPGVAFCMSANAVSAFTNQLDNIVDEMSDAVAAMNQAAGERAAAAAAMEFFGGQIDSARDALEDAQSDLADARDVLDMLNAMLAELCGAMPNCPACQ